MNENIPWIEKYRPTIFDNIILDPMNKKNNEIYAGNESNT